jgi:hypothetical protein
VEWAVSEYEIAEYQIEPAQLGTCIALLATEAKPVLPGGFRFVPARRVLMSDAMYSDIGVIRPTGSA